MYVTKTIGDAGHKAIVMIALATRHVVGSAVSIAQDISRPPRKSMVCPAALLLHLYARGLNTEVCVCIILLLSYE